MSSATPPNPEALLARVDWVARLARRLVRDPATAEDLAQEAWLSALERPSAGGSAAADPRAWRAWIAGVLRNLARAERRGRERRLERERAAARSEGGASQDEALARAALHRDVVDALLALEEPYRTTLVLRWFEDLPPRGIAARQGVPVTTVKSRLARGHGLLRARLDRAHGGDGRAWALALLPLVAAQPGGPLEPPLARLSSPWSTLLSAKARLAVACLSLAGLALWVQRDARAPRVPAAGPPALAAAREPAGSAGPLLPLEEERTEEGPAGREPRAAAPAPPSASELLEGLVVDLEDRPVAGVPLGLRASMGSTLDVRSGVLHGSVARWHEELSAVAPLAVSDAAGRFRLVPVRQHGSVVALGEAWETVFAPDRDAEELVVVVAPLGRLGGRVLDEEQRPVAGAELRLLPPSDLARHLTAPLAGAQLCGWSAESDAQGGFAFARVPVVAGSSLLARAEGFVEREIALPHGALAQEGWVDVVLSRMDAGARLEGLVLGPGGPLEGARVALHEGPGLVGSGSLDPLRPGLVRSARTDASGRFSLSLAGAEDATRLVACAAGFLPVSFPGEHEELPRDAAGRARWPELVTLVLDQPARELRGLVRRPDGAPAAGVRVWLLQGTAEQERGEARPVLLETILAGRPEEPWMAASTDAEGRFVLSGLAAREYSLRLEDPRTALLADVGTFAASAPGSGAAELQLVLPQDGLWPEVRGRVLRADGLPVAGALITVRSIPSSAQSADGTGFLVDSSGSQARTGEDGSFVLADVPRRSAWLEVQREGFFPRDLWVSELQGRTDELEIVLDRRARLQVHLSGTELPATRFEVFDASGRNLRLEYRTLGPWRGPGCPIPPAPGEASRRSPVAEVAESGAWLVLYAGDQELQRVPLRLVAGELTTLEL